MPIASDAINDSRAFASDQVSNTALATAAMNQIIGMPPLSGRQLTSAVDFELPEWNAALIEAPGPIAIGEIPKFTDRYAGPAASELPAAPDIRQTMLDALREFDPVTQAALLAAMEAWLTAYAPGYRNAMNTLYARLEEGLNGTAIVEAVEQAMHTRLVDRIEAENAAQQTQIVAGMRKRGYEMPQIVLSAELNRNAKAIADRNALAAVEVYIERTKIELQHKQFCLQAASQLQQAVQSAFLQFAGVVAGLKKYALDYAVALANALSDTYKAQVNAFETRLKAAMSLFEAAVNRNRAELDTYRTQLEVQLQRKKLEYERMKLQLESARIPYEAGVTAQIKEVELEMEGLKAASVAATQAMDAMARIAQAAMSSINAIANVSAEE